jgi:hypothetical protein
MNGGGEVFLGELQRSKSNLARVIIWAEEKDGRNVECNSLLLDSA